MAINPNDPYGLLAKNNKLSGIKPPKSPYGGFWRRLCALFLDTLVLSPLIILIFFLREQHRLFYAYYLPFAFIIGIIYNIYLVKRFGGTPGKILMKLRIRKIAGSPIGYKEAILRFLPDSILSLLSSFALIMTLLNMTDAEFLSAAAGKRYIYINTLKTNWGKWIETAGQIWLWSEFIVLLTNKKKRAVHDYIAGTVVMKKSAIDQAAQAQAASSTNHSYRSD